MKKYKKTLTVIIILIVAVIMFASFFGVYKKNENGEKVNLIPNLQLGMEFGKTRIITAKISDETVKTIYDKDGNVVEEEPGVEYTEEAGYKVVEQQINSDSLKTVDNYNKTKQMIEERLKANKITEYFIDMNKTTGDIKIEIPENEKADTIQSFLRNSGTLMLLDGTTFEVVFDSTTLEKTEVMYSQGDIETGVFLQLSFNEEGIKKLEELNNIYVEKTVETTNEAGETVQSTEQKVVYVVLNDAIIGSTILPNIYYNNKIMLTYGISSNADELQTAMENADKEAVLLNTGNNPLAYDFTNEVKETNISDKTIGIYSVALGTIFIIAYIYLVVKFKAKGFISVYFQVGFLAVLLLVLRYTNVILTMEGMAGIVIGMVLEYIFTYIVLNTLSSEVEGMYRKANLQFFLNTFPIYVVSVVFTFATKANINSFGMTLFWGIMMIYIYNFIFSKFIFENLSRRSA